MIIEPQRIERILEKAALAGVATYQVPGDENFERRSKPTVAAAVLIPLVQRPDGPTVILTQRSAHLKDHAGQISFPGGRVEPEDANVHATALREAHEEIGLMPEDVQILGGLRPYQTITGFQIYPSVGWIKALRPFLLDPIEVDDAFEVPLAFIMDRSNHRRESGMRDGKRRYFYVFRYEQRYIWGATAAMLVNLARVIEVYGNTAEPA